MRAQEPRQVQSSGADALAHALHESPSLIGALALRYHYRLPVSLHGYSATDTALTIAGPQHLRVRHFYRRHHDGDGHREMVQHD